MGHAIDLSYAQGVVNFDALASDTDLDLVISQATHGTAGYDVQFARNWEESKRIGRRRCAYHFAYPAGPNADDDAIAQADHLWAVVSAAGFGVGDMLALDLEVDGGGEEWAIAFMRRINGHAGSVQVFYSDLGYIRSTVNNGLGGLGQVSLLWVAALQGNEPACPPGWPTITFWQFSFTGREPGVGDAVDLDAEEAPLPAAATPTALFLLCIGADMTPECFVRACYATILDREVESPEAFQTMVSFYKSHGDDLTLAAFIDSPEGQLRLKQRRSLLDAQKV